MKAIYFDDAAALILAAAEVDFDDHVNGAQIERASHEAERRLRDRFPGIPVRVPRPDPTRPDPTRGRAGHNHVDGGADI